MKIVSCTQQPYQPFTDIQFNPDGGLFNGRGAREECTERRTNLFVGKLIITQCLSRV